jgi:hypothetical protein
MKYKQKIIPSIIVPNYINRSKISELKKYAKDYYKKNLQGKVIKNECLGHTISLSGQGIRKLTQGSVLYTKKVAVIYMLSDVLKYAEYSNFGQRKSNDPIELIGYYNFKCKVKINNKIEHIRIATMLYKDGRIYFGHEVNLIK